ncbi:MAG TPA: DUF742 domain-containing protein [Rugosimonospora sp.]|nr:DUF742 domain-containing protein [Rugosimonospora sp.]
MTPPAGQDGAPDHQTAGRIPPYLAAQLPVDPAGTGADDEAALAQGQLRPFVLTSGRVEGAPEIGLETQVTARGAWDPPPARLAPELQVIIALCREPVSVAEISARAGLHLGVTKILVGDLHASGYLEVHAFDPSLARQPETILRVIRGLRAIP